MGLLLKIAIFAVAAYTVWTVVRRWYGVLGGRRPEPPARADHRPQPQKAPQRATIEDTYPCKICGAYVMASARKCERGDCPQPA
jgi:hypothetical protein